MSKYTTEVRYICEVNAGLDESAGYNDIDTVIANSRAKIFDFSYPIFDDNYKSVLETKILKHYYTREIGAETVGLWKLWLNARMNEIMPYYNKLYESELIKFDPMRDYDITKEGEKTGVGNVVNSGEDVTTNVGNGSANSDTEYGGEDSITEANEPKTDRWDMYSDTPQGDVIAMTSDEFRYLTNARHITESGVGSNREETREYGQTVGTDTTYEDTNTSTLSHGKVTDATNTDEWIEHVYGKISGTSYSKLLQEFRETFLNIDVLIIRDLADLFLNLW